MVPEAFAPTAVDVPVPEDSSVDVHPPSFTIILSHISSSVVIEPAFIHMFVNSSVGNSFLTITVLPDFVCQVTVTILHRLYFDLRSFFIISFSLLSI